jgi:peptide/nickel transport system permease protein
MAPYILRRLGWVLVVLWAIITLTFGATFLSPIDPARSYVGPRASKQVYEAARHQFGLDRPLYIQYLKYFDRLGHADLGYSISTGQSVRSAIFARLPATAELAAAGLVIELVLGVPLGLVAALRRRHSADRVILAGSLAGVVTPQFVLGFLLLYVFAFRMGWFPLGGSTSLQALILPALTLGLPGAAWYARMLRSTTLNILSEDYIRFARAKGMSERVVISRHLVRNAISPIVTMVGLDFGVFFGGVLIIERVFAWPGIGLQAWNAIGSNDIPMVIGTVLVAAFFIAIFNLAADVANALIDPRIAYA